MHCRIREEQLQRDKEQEVSRLQLDHRRQSEEMLSNFAQAQDILKSKIDEYKFMYAFFGPYTTCLSTLAE